MNDDMEGALQPLLAPSLHLGRSKGARAVFIITASPSRAYSHPSADAANCFARRSSQNEDIRVSTTRTTTETTIAIEPRIRTALHILRENLIAVLGALVRGLPVFLGTGIAPHY